MIHASATLALHSVEAFLTGPELDQLRKIVDTEHDATGWRPRFQAEVVTAPAQAQDILHDAGARALPAMRRAIPSLAGVAPWGYTELGVGERVPSHLDGIPDPTRSPRRIGRIGVVLVDADAGGDFYVETTAADTAWTHPGAGRPDEHRDGTPPTRERPHDDEPAWITGIPRPRRPATTAGDAVAYGALVVHGVTPVTVGRLRAFVADLLGTTTTGPRADRRPARRRGA